MTIAISAQLTAQLQQKATAEGLTVEAYVERLIREDAAWAETTEESLQETNPEFDEIRAAVSEGLAQAERGEGKPAREVFAELRNRNGVSRLRHATRPPQDLDRIYDWVLSSAPIAGPRWFERFENSISSLSSLPTRCPVDQKLSTRRQSIRKLVFGTTRHKYRVYFTIRGRL